MLYLRSYQTSFPRTFTFFGIGALFSGITENVNSVIATLATALYLLMAIEVDESGASC